MFFCVGGGQGERQRSREDLEVGDTRVGAKLATESWQLGGVSLKLR